MSALLELSSFKKHLSDMIGQSNMDDCPLPKAFKEKFTSFGEYKIERYNGFTAMVSSKKSMITIPNQWFFIAGCCCQYHLELVKYRNRLIELGIDDDKLEACHPSKDNKLIPDSEKTQAACENKAKQYLAFYEGEDKDLLIDFLWNYDAWGGGKNIKRSNDFTESPVLNIANTINASSSLIGSIAKGLASQLECLNLLLNSNEWKIVYSHKPSSIEHEPIHELNRFADFVFKTLNACDDLRSMMKFVSEKESWLWFVDSTNDIKARIFRKDYLQGQTMSEPLVVEGARLYTASGWDYDDKKSVPSFGVLKYIVDTCYNQYYSIEKKQSSEGQVEFVLYVKESQHNNNCTNISNKIISHLTAIRTKPFLLLAGISGTGKSRIVREFAFKSCPQYLQDKDGTTPGNYCMIEVKPNWHDSTELLGYYSRLGSKPGYQFTKFVKYLVKAKMFPEVPFFICLDEMNLAPVEQYFAEILSILETRKVVIGEDGNKTIKTEAIIDAEHFKALGKIGGFAPNFTDRDIYLKLFGIDTESDIDKEVGGRTDLTTEGLTLPDNVVIIGTVNMDDTTHQFSRKVIDRAMTIEMNGGNLRSMFGGSKNLEYLQKEEQEKWQNAFTRRYVTADEVLEAYPDVAEELKDKLPSKLEEINKALKGTPFEVSYRVLNELTIMVGVMLYEGRELDDAIVQSVNNILLMKILPRIEGDAEMFAMSREYKTKVGVAYDNRLEWLKDIAPDIKESSADAESGNDDTEENAAVVKEHQQTAKEKIQEMIDRLDNQEFTRFWP